MPVLWVCLRHLWHSSMPSSMAFWSTNCAAQDVPALGLRERVRHRTINLGHLRSIIVSATGVSALAGSMFDCALAFLLSKVGSKLMVGSHYRPRLLDWHVRGHHRSEPQATAVTIRDPNVVTVIETVGSTPKLWKFPPCSAGRPFERPSSTSFGNCICEFNEGLQ